MQFRDLQRQYQHLKNEIDASVQEVISSAQFISGKQVRDLEEKLAAYVGVRHCITCGNGTDALSIALLAWGVGPGDAVFVPDFTFFSSGECPAALGAVPVFVDVCRDTYNMDAVSLEREIKRVIAEGKLAPKVVVTVDLFGLPAEYDRLRAVCDEYHLLLLEDGAQGFGGELHGKKACSFGDISTTSFFPAKPLGCYGDGGAIFTEDDETAGLCRSIAVHGKNADNKYDNVRLGMNSRLDTLQAAILLPKFEAFRKYELDAVNRVADIYRENLKDMEELKLPIVKEGYYSSWAQYTIQLPAGTDRARIQACMKEQGIPSMIYYGKPMHCQGAFAGTDSANADCPVTEELCGSVLCLPIHPFMADDEAVTVAKALKAAVGRQQSM